MDPCNAVVAAFRVYVGLIVQAGGFGRVCKGFGMVQMPSSVGCRCGIWIRAMRLWAPSGVM